jgi:hypothetical protein
MVTRREFVEGVVLGAIACSVGVIVSKAQPDRSEYDPAYLAACYAAGVPEEEIGAVVVCERQTFSLASNREVWKPVRFEKVQVGDIIRILNADGLELTSDRCHVQLFKVKAMAFDSDPHRSSIVVDRL